MIQRLVAFALHQRFITLALAALLTAGGIASFYRLPIEAYPDVVDVAVDVITIWPGHAAEEVERLVTTALEKESGVGSGELDEDFGMLPFALFRNRGIDGDAVFEFESAVGDHGLEKFSDFFGGSDFVGDGHRVQLLALKF